MAISMSRTPLEPLPYTGTGISRTLKAMEVHFAPDLQAKIDRLVRETGRTPDKLLEHAMADTFPNLCKRAKCSTAVMTI
jgi:hypothetical protein